MKKQLVTIFFAGILIFSCQNIFAQEAIIPNRGCGTVEYNKILEEKDPSIKAKRAEIEEQVRIYIEKNKKNPTPQAVVTIPVVFHIVYNPATPAENVSDACITAQLQVLNNDFRRLNSDWTNVTQPGFGALVADCEIEFCLAVRDPDNNPTTGITRTATTVASFASDNKVKYDSLGGHNVWNRDKFLNIWVCDLTSPLLGYTQYPGQAAATDGFVCDYQYMIGTAGCGTAPYDKGRTSTHEIGHFFGLYHIWGDDGIACSGTDLVTDTPNQSDETYGCLTAGTEQTDVCATTSPGIMWMNYMDYTNDACMYMFTNGQKARIDATLNGARASLKTSDGCTPLSIAELLLSSESLSVYPNPSTGNFSLSLKIANISTADLAIYNAIGEIVLEKKITVTPGNDIEVNLDKNPDGIYLIEMKTAEGTIAKKVVISR